MKPETQLATNATWRGTPVKIKKTFENGDILVQFIDRNNDLRARIVNPKEVNRAETTGN
jgi:hypothetical protein